MDDGENLDLIVGDTIDQDVRRSRYKKLEQARALRQAPLKRKLPKVRRALSNPITNSPRARWAFPAKVSLDVVQVA